MTPNTTLYQFKYKDDGTLLREEFPAERTDTFLGSFYTIKPYIPDQPAVPLRIAATALGRPGWPSYDERERQYRWEARSVDSCDLRVLSTEDNPDAAGKALLNALRELRLRLDAKTALVARLLDAVDPEAKKNKAEVAGRC